MPSCQCLPALQAAWSCTSADSSMAVHLIRIVNMYMNTIRIRTHHNISQQHIPTYQYLITQTYLYLQTATSVLDFQCIFPSRDTKAALWHTWFGWESPWRIPVSQTGSKAEYEGSMTWYLLFGSFWWYFRHNKIIRNSNWEVQVHTHTLVNKRYCHTLSANIRLQNFKRSIQFAQDETVISIECTHAYIWNRYHVHVPCA